MSGAALAIYRMRAPLYVVAAVVLIGNALVGRLLAGGQGLRLGIVFAAMALAALCLVLTFVGPRLLHEVPVRVVQSPVHGRWLAMNSPASAVPSHGVRAYGQAHAIDLVHAPTDEARPELGGELFRANSEYPAFGEPVYAMVDGTVVRSSDWRRDHRARSNSVGIAYMMLEGMIREVGGPGWIVGNHIVIRTDDGAYAAVAHLQQGSTSVRVGERVHSGDVIGNCGNSGNSSEPHVHAQLMDRASLWTAQGIPMAFAGVMIDDGDDGDDPVDALPSNGQYLRAARPARRRKAA
ncbi:MAG: M23 family metallopeptidase [Leucobacter sp.]